MKNFRKSLVNALQSFTKKLPAKNKLPFFTLSFTLAALIVTIIAVQQQQTLIQEAAEREICPTETAENNGNSDSTVVTQGPEVNVTIQHTENPPAVITSGTSGGSAQTAARKVDGQLIVKYKKDKNNDKDKKSAEDKVKRKKGKVKKRLQRLRMDVMQVPTAESGTTLSELKSDPNVEAVYYDYYAYGGEIPNDSDFGKLYGMNNTGQNGGKNDADIDAPEAWDKTKGSKNIKIAILDTGIDESHPDLKGKIVAKQDFVEGSTNATDGHGHGTHVAGTAAAIGNNSKGVIGVCPECSLLVGKVLDGNMNGPISGIIEGINWAVEQKANVISMSLSTSADRSQIVPLEDAVNEAVSSGIVVVALAGNCGDNNFKANHCNTQNQVVYPAGYDNVLTVAATDNKDQKTSWSNSGSHVDVAAPGNAIYSTAPGGGYKELSGTSQATPHVAGLAGLLMSQGASAQQVVTKIQNTADKISGTGSLWKYGRINAANAVGGIATAPEDGDDSGDDTSPKPSKVKTPKPCKPAKNNGNKNPTKKTPTPVKNDTNREPSDPQAAACRMLPSLPFCNKRANNSNNNSNNTNNNIANNPCTNENSNNRNGNNRNGQSTTSNNQGTTTTGRIDNDGTSDTQITINGQSVTLHNAKGGAAGEDIDTGGQQGGNHQTNININQNGQNQTSNQSGGNNNKPNNTTNPCNTPNNSKTPNTAKKDDKKNNNAGGNSGGGGGNSFFCRFLPRLKFCQDETKRNENDRKKKEADDKKKKEAEEKKKKDEEAKKNGTDKACKKNSDCSDGKVCNQNKCQKKEDVKGVSDDQTLQTIKTCISATNPSSCTPDMRAVADVNGDAKITQTDYTVYLNSK